MHKKIIFISTLLLVALVLSGAACTASKDDGTSRGIADTDTNTNSNTNAVINVGDLTWCAAGQAWSGIVPGEASARFEIIGPTTYSGTTVCHMRYTSSSAQGDMVMDYYIVDEEETEAWLVMSMNGVEYSTMHFVNGEML